MAKLILKQVYSVMGDMTARMDQMNCNALLVSGKGPFIKDVGKFLTPTPKNTSD